MEIGDKFGRWVVVGGRERIGAKYFRLCKCLCGEVRKVNTAALLNMGSKSCGCLQREVTSQRCTTHGRARHPLFKTWEGMLRRCSERFMHPNYIGRGITVCERWQSFENFLADMGERPFDGATLDRINNDGNYEPGNVRWASRKEQGRNKRTNKVITFKNKTMCLVDWAEYLNLDYRLLKSRIYAHKWPIEKALTLPKQRKRRELNSTNTS